MTFVPRSAGAAAFAAALLIGCGLLAPPAQAGYMVTLLQQGPNVVASGSGTIDLSGLTLFLPSTDAVALINPPRAGILTGPTALTLVDGYMTPTGPTSFGSRAGALANNGNGDLVGVTGSPQVLFVPAGYTSGNFLSDSATYDGKTFASLGVTPGTYTWRWASDSFTVQIGPAAVPEPSALALLALPLGFVALIAVRRRA